MLLHSFRGFRVEISIYIAISINSIYHIFLYQYHIIVVLKFGGLRMRPVNNPMRPKRAICIRMMPVARC